MNINKDLIGKTLKDMMPREFMGFTDIKAYEFRDVAVVCERALALEDDGIAFKSWPGTHKNVTYWVELENGYAVGFNENVCVGWSFPVVKL